MFERNVGQLDSYSINLNGEIPTNREYRLEISPSSARRENFPPLYVNIEIVSYLGRYDSYEHPFTTGLNVGILLLFIFILIYFGFRLWHRRINRLAEDETHLNFMGNDVE
jgi:hypothetical protein